MKTTFKVIIIFSFFQINIMMTIRCCKFYQTIFFFCLIELLDGKILEETQTSTNDEVIKENFLSNRDLKVCEFAQRSLWFRFIWQAIICGVVGFWGGVFVMGALYLLLALTKMVFKPEDDDKSPAWYFNLSLFCYKHSITRNLYVR